MLGRNSVRSASTIPVGTTLLTGNRPTAHQASPTQMTGARRRVKTMIASAATTSARPSASDGPMLVRRTRSSTP